MFLDRNPFPVTFLTMTTVSWTFGWQIFDDDCCCCFCFCCDSMKTASHDEIDTHHRFCKIRSVQNTDKSLFCVVRLHPRVFLLGFVSAATNRSSSVPLFSLLLVSHPLTTMTTRTQPIKTQGQPPLLASLPERASETASFGPQSIS